MIRTFEQLVGRKKGGKLNRLYGIIVLEGVLSGLGLVVLVPLLRRAAEGDISSAWNWAAVMGIIWLSYAGVRWGSQLIGLRLSIEIGRGLFHRLGDHIARLPMGWFSKDRVGEVSRLASQGVVNMMGVPAHLARHLLTAITTPLTVLICLIWFDWRLAAAAFSALPLIWFSIKQSAHIFQQEEHRVYASAVETTDRIVEFAQSQKTLRAFGCQKDSATSLDKALFAQHEAAKSLLLNVNRGLFGVVLSIQISLVIVLIVSVNLALGGQIEAAELVTLLFLIIRYVEPIMTAAQIEGALKAGRNNVERMQSILNTPLLDDGNQKFDAERGDIAFNKVDFAYDDMPVLRDISVAFPEGSMTAIVGPSGAGKTTLFRLICRQWDVDEGTITIGGVDIRQLAVAELMQQISIVFQDTYLFEGTIYENILLGNPDCSTKQMAQAVKLAGVSEITNRLRDGMDSLVGEGGSLLSGGERQRIAIARALLKRARILLLDEATAALDPINESALQSTFANRSKNQTLIVIAHRLQTIRSADVIVFLEDGQIIEKGTHEELLLLGKRYAEFWRARNQATGWRLEKKTPVFDAI